MEISKSDIKFFFIPENINEEDFPDYISKEGFNCIKFSHLNLHHCGKAGIPISPQDYNYIGKPDFFIWNDQEFYFCEFKNGFKRDALRTEQLFWFHKHHHFPKAIAFTYFDKENDKTKTTTNN